MVNFRGAQETIDQYQSQAHCRQPMVAEEKSMPGHRPPNQAHKSQSKSAHKQFLDNPAIIIPAFRLGGGAPDDDQKCLEIELLVDTQEDKHSSRRAPNDGFADASAFANQCGPDAKQCSQDVTNRGGPARQRGTVDSFYPDGQYPVQKTFIQIAADVSQLDFIRMQNRDGLRRLLLL